MSRRSQFLKQIRDTQSLNRKAIPLNPIGPDADVAAQLPLQEVGMDEAVANGSPPNAGFPLDIPVRLFRLGECSVIWTIMNYGHHLSIAHPSRDPTWAEISSARYRILPDGIWMAMYLPPRDHYVNVHRFCYQMTQVREPDQGKIP